MKVGVYETYHLADGMHTSASVVATPPLKRYGKHSNNHMMNCKGCGRCAFVKRHTHVVTLSPHPISQVGGDPRIHAFASRPMHACKQNECMQGSVGQRLAYMIITQHVQHPQPRGGGRRELRDGLDSKFAARQEESLRAHHKNAPCFFIDLTFLHQRTEQNTHSECVSALSARVCVCVFVCKDVQRVS